MRVSSARPVGPVAGPLEVVDVGRLTSGAHAGLTEPAIEAAGVASNGTQPKPLK